jgi:hypothetical protein
MICDDLRQELGGRPCQVSAPELAELAAHPELTPRKRMERGVAAAQQLNPVDPQFKLFKCWLPSGNLT